MEDTMKEHEIEATDTNKNNETVTRDTSELNTLNRAEKHFFKDTPNGIKLE